MRVAVTLVTPTLALLSAANVRAQSIQDALRPAGIQASHIGDLWNLTLGLCTLVFIAVLAMFLRAVWRAPRSGAATPPDTSSITVPERRIHRGVLWSVVLATVGLFVLLIADVRTSRALAGLPLSDAVHIDLIGHQWWWEARYTDPQPSRMFTTANELHIPVGRPVIISLQSNDVIHTLWVPNLHGKKDLIPGRTALIQLRADRPGAYRGQCAEFCGLEHALMAMLVTAQPPNEYEAWAEAQRQPAPQPSGQLEMRGLQVFQSTTCVMCHAIQGTSANARTGPDLTHLASRQTIAAGSLPNTRGHLAAWILDPQKSKPGVNMPATPLSPADLQALLAYLETLK
ncbi:MAG: hypothetical protein JWR21_2765 [Herminiimonas sp.]|nr:hypothetical protein [Herminiimonas sp.]